MKIAIGIPTQSAHCLAILDLFCCRFTKYQSMSSEVAKRLVGLAFYNTLNCPRHPRNLLRRSFTQEVFGCLGLAFFLLMVACSFGVDFSSAVNCWFWAWRLGFVGIRGSDG